MSASQGAPSSPPAWAYEDRGQAVMAIYWTETAIALVFVLARLYARTTLRSLGTDDLFMLISLTAFVALSGIVTSIALEGGFRYAMFVPPGNASSIALKDLIAQAVTIFAYGTSKFSVGYLILRLLPPTSIWRKRSIWTVISFTIFYNWLQIILTFIQCSPPRGAWDFTVESQCWSQASKFVSIYIGGTYNVIVDIYLALLPATFIRKLNMTVRQRATLCVLLALGLIAAICGTVKLTYVPSLGQAGATWNAYDLIVWSGSELFVIIVCGSVPPLKVLWDRYFLRPHRSQTESYQFRGGGSNSYAMISKSSATRSDKASEKVPTGSPN